MMLLLAAAEKSALTWLLGAFHPGIVHFPIALLAVAAALEVNQMAAKRRTPHGGTPILAYLSAATAVPAAFFGFMLAEHGGAEGGTVELHKWLGLASTFASLAAAACAWKASGSTAALAGLRLTLLGGAFSVLAAGYVGGELTGGEGHILKPLKALLGLSSEPKKEVAEKPAEKPTEKPAEKPVEKPAEKPLLTPAGDKVDFVKDIAPVIKDMCFKCHGGEKVKGKFKLNTKKDAMDGGESGKAINPGKPTLSKFYTSLIDPDEDILMPPPKEKARPSKDQIEKVKKWIEQGADWPDGFEFKK